MEPITAWSIVSFFPPLKSTWAFFAVLPVQKSIMCEGQLMGVLLPGPSHALYEINWIAQNVVCGQETISCCPS